MCALADALLIQYFEPVIEAAELSSPLLYTHVMGAHILNRFISPM